MNITEINYKEKMCNTEKTLLISMFRVTFYRPFNLKTCFFLQTWMHTAVSIIHVH